MDVRALLLTASLLPLLLVGACDRDPIGDLTRASLGPDPTSAYAVWVLRAGPSPPGSTGLDLPDLSVWHRDTTAIAHAFSSLHAFVWDDLLVVPGLSSARPPTWLEERLPTLAIGALVTRDLVRWEARSWRVDAPGVSLIDPALVRGPAGVELWFVQVDGPGDPGAVGRAVRIVRTRWDGQRFGAAETWAEGRGLVDPSPVWFDGAWRVFATRDHAAVVVLDGPDRAPREVLSGASVPFAFEEGGEVTVLAQRPEGPGMAAVAVRSADTRTWSAPVRIMNDSGLQTCASPVTARYRGEHVMLCVDERRAARLGP